MMTKDMLEHISTRMTEPVMPQLGGRSCRKEGSWRQLAIMREQRVQPANAFTVKKRDLRVGVLDKKMIWMKFKKRHCYHE
jgi:hypothetical protein